MPDQLTAHFSSLNERGDNPPAWFCIFACTTGAPIALWNEEHGYWVTFEEQAHIPALDHLDPHKIETGEQEIILFKEGFKLDADYETMTTSYLQWLVDNSEEDEVREAAEEEITRRKDHYEIIGEGVNK